MIHVSPATVVLMTGALLASGLSAPGMAADILTPINIRHVKVHGEIGRRIDITINNNVMVLKADQDFLRPFLEKNHTSGYIGLGKLIDATVRFAAYSGDQKVLARKNHLVDTVIGAQEADGYIGMMAPDSRVTKLWDVHEMGYLVYGLATDFEYFHNRRSLEAARRAADYIIRHWPDIPADWGQQTGVATHVAVTGLERAMLTLGRLTGDRKYIDFCRDERGLPTWDLGIVIGRRPLIEGHIYAYLCRSLAQIELDRIDADPRLPRPADRAIQFMTHGDGTAITGGSGQWETWTDDQDGRGALAETCATAYTVRLYGSLLQMRGAARFGDLMERTIYNSLFAAQSPDGRKIRYYTPTEGPRAYHPGDTYCCPCNYRRIIAELPAMIYYRARDGVAVNLFAQSEATMKLADGTSLQLKQETDYPNSGRVVIHVDPDRTREIAIQLRIPAWCKVATVRVNDMAPEQVAGGRFHAIRRRWKPGDTIRLEMPMTWRLVRGRKRQSGRVAVMRGPLLFCLDPDQDKSLADQDGADLGQITLDPQSLGEPVADDSVRPDGLACLVRAWKPGYTCARPGNLKLKLTEFTDPDGRATYFRLQDFRVATDDELFHGPSN